MKRYLCAFLMALTAAGAFAGCSADEAASNAGSMADDAVSNAGSMVDDAASNAGSMIDDAASNAGSMVGDAESDADSDLSGEKTKARSSDNNRNNGMVTDTDGFIGNEDSEKSLDERDDTDSSPNGNTKASSAASNVLI